MTNKTQMTELSWYEFRDAMAMNDLVILPVGAMAAHGLHAPLGTDKILAEELARRIGAGAGVPVAPAVPFGVSRSTGDFPGTLTMDPDLLRRFLTAICESYYAHGAKRFLIINGHAGNSAAVHMTCCDLHKAHENVLAVQSEWWNTVPQLSQYPCDDRGGQYETSLLLAVDETLCDMTRARTAARKGLTPELTDRFKGARVNNAGGMPLSALSPYGNFGSPCEKADKATGKAMLDLYVDYCVRLVRELKRVYL